MSNNEPTLCMQFSFARNYVIEKLPVEIPTFFAPDVLGLPPLPVPRSAVTRRKPPPQSPGRASRGRKTCLRTTSSLQCPPAIAPHIAANCVQRLSTSSPATISTAPITCINVDGLTGITLVASGLRYIVQSVNRLKYLSIPAMIGPTPSPIRKTHQLAFRRSSNSCIAPSTLMSAELTGGYTDVRNRRKAPVPSPKKLQNSL